MKKGWFNCENFKKSAPASERYTMFSDYSKKYSALSPRAANF